MLSSTRVVASSLSDLISQAMLASEDKENQQGIAEAGVKSKVEKIFVHYFQLCFQNVETNIANLLKSIQTVEDANSRGQRAIETAVEAISQDLAACQSSGAPPTESTPAELQAATRAVTQAVAKAAMAANSGNQDQVAAVANFGMKAVHDLLAACKVTW